MKQGLGGRGGGGTLLCRYLPFKLVVLYCVPCHVQLQVMVWKGLGEVLFCVSHGPDGLYCGA